MIESEQPYLDLLRKVFEDGEIREDRTGTGVKSIFGSQMRFNLEEGFPAITTKKLAFKTMVTELLWFISGSTNVKDLQRHNCKIWNEWEGKDGTIGPGYSKQWRKWDKFTKLNDGSIKTETVDQLAAVVKSIKTNPYSRRHIVNAWNVSDLEDMSLPPCHLLFQFFVSADRKLSCHLYQRSGDLGLGVNFNTASYALLTHIIADICELKAGEFIHTIGDAHIYLNHIEQMKELLGRKPFKAPTIVMPPRKDSIDDYALGKMTASDFALKDYKFHPPIHMKVSV